MLNLIGGSLTNTYGIFENKLTSQNKKNRFKETLTKNLTRRNKINVRRIILTIFSVILIASVSYIVLKLSKPAIADWWGSNVNGVSWQKRKQLTIVNTSTATLSSGTAVAITVDTKSLYDLYYLKSDCSDLRIVYQDGTNITELTRYVDVPNGLTCATSTNTKVFFQLQTALTTLSSSTYYYMYYSNSQATAPTGTDAVFTVGSATATLVCPFDGTTTCAASETNTAASPGALRYSGSKSGLSFNGSSDYTSAGDSTSLSITGDMTIEAWVKLNNVTSEQTLAAKWDETTANNYRSYRLYLTSGGKFAFAVSSDGTSGNTTTITGSTTTAAVNTWYHVAGVYDHAGKLDIYINGTKDASEVTGGVTSINDNISSFYTGVKKNTSGTLDTYLSGVLDEVRVSDVIRYSSNFTTTNNAFVRDAHTKLLYHFDENGADPTKSNTAIDDSGNQNDGTITGATYVGGLVGVASSANDTGKLATQSFASHQGVMIEEGTVNKITNPSFENSTYDSGWTNTDTQTGTATVVASAGTVVRSSGRPTQSHLFYAENSGYWWLLYIDSTNVNQLKSKYSSNLTSWSSGATLTLARNHDSDGANFAVAYKNISSTDVVHVAITYNPSNTSHYNYHVRGTISGTTLSWGTEAAVGAQNPNSTSGANNDSPIVTYDSNNYVWVGTGFVYEPSNTTYIGDNNVFQSTNADAGSSWTAGFQAAPTEVSLAPAGFIESRFMTSLGSGKLLTILDNNSPGTGYYTNLQTFKYDTGSCTGDYWCNNVNAFASNIAQQDVTQWGAVAVSTSDIHVVSFTNTTTGAAIHRRYNGSSWSNGATIGNIPNSYSTEGGGLGNNIFMTTDNTNVWMFAKENDTANTLVYNKWSAASNTWGGWTSFETTTQTRHSLSGYPAAKNGTIGVLWNQNNSTNRDLVVKGYGYSTVSKNTSAPYVKFGSNSVKIATSLANSASYVTSVTPGNSSHTLSAYVYDATTGNVGGTVSASVAKLIFNGSAQTTTYTNAGGGWWRLTYNGTANAGAQNFGIEVETGRTVYIDGFQLEQKASVTSYADGSLGTGYFWNNACDGTTQSGTANADCSARTVGSITYPTSGNLAASAGSISFWFKEITNPTTAIYLRNYNTSSNGIIIERVGTNYIFDYYPNNVTPVDISYDTGGAETGKWHHLVATWDVSANHIYLFLDGVSRGTQTGTMAVNTLAATTYIGSDSNINNSSDAVISDLRFYSAALTSTQVADAYYSTLASHFEGNPVDAFSDTKGQNPVAIWHMDEATGSKANDASTYGNNLTLSNTIWNADSRSNPTQRKISLKFDGTSSVASRAWDSDFDFATSPFSISGWFKHSSTALSTSQYILSRYGSAGYKVYMNTSGYLCFGIDSDSTWGGTYDNICSTSGQGSLADSVWHHFEAVRDTSNIYLYLDGKEVNTIAITNATGTLNSSATLYIGADSDGASNFFSGQLDEIVIYPYARSAAQVKTDMPDPSTATLGANTTDPLTNALIGYWKLDETASPAVDSSGNADNGTWGAAASYITGKFGNAISLSGSANANISMGDAATLRNLPNSNFTVSAWIYPTSAPAANADRIIISKDNSNDYHWHISIENYDAVTTRLVATIDNIAFSRSVDAVSLNTWSLITAAFKPADKYIHLYINGKEVAYETYSPMSGTYSGDTGFNFKIGSSSDNAAYFIGRIDEARVYTRLLSPNEISQLYNFAPGPVGYWKFDENTGVTAADSSGNGDTANLGGPTNDANKIPVWTQGKVGSALKFDGVSGQEDYLVPINGNSLLDGAGAFTISSWVKYDSLNDWAAIIQKQASTTNQIFYGLGGTGEGGNDDFEICVDNSANTCVYTTGNIVQTGTWYHYTAVFDGSQTTARIYVNGIQQTTSALGTMPSAVGTINQPLYIGTFGAYATHGIIDDLKIYNYARTQKQIVEDMNGDHPAVTSNSMVGYWKFDEGYGDTVHDNSQYGNNGNNNPTETCPDAGTSLCATWSNSGKFGKALNFTPDITTTGTYFGVSLGDPASLRVPTNSPITLSAWINLNALPATNDGRDIICKTGRLTNSSITESYCLALWNSSGTTSLYVGSAQGTPTQTSWNLQNFNLHEWHHVVGLYDGTQWQLYVDSQLKSSTTTSGPIYGLGNVVIGAGDPESNSYFKYYFNGLIDEVKVYNYALTSDEIKLDYNHGKSIVLGSFSDTSQVTGTPIPKNSSAAAYCIPGSADPCSPPVSEWKFDENTGTSAYDTSNNNNTSIWHGTGSYWTAGKIGAAGNFNGTNNYTNINPGLTVLDNKAAMTISAWVKPSFASNAPSLSPKSIITIGSFGPGINFPEDGSEYYVECDGYNSIGTNINVNTSFTTNPSWSANTWHFVTCRYTGSTFELYWDGKFIKSTGASGSIHANTDISYIGSVNTNTNLWSGSIDQVQIFDYARTPAQIAWDYNRGAPIVQYNFDECQGTTLHDSSGNGYHGTITPNAGRTAGTCNSGVSTEMWNGGTVGKFNSSLDFEGTVSSGDYAVINSPINLSNDSQISLSFWLNWNTYADNDALALESSSDYNNNSGAILIDPNSSASGGGLFEVSIHGVGYRTETFSRPSAGAWHHYVFIFDGSTSANDIQIYVDGIQKTSTVQSSNSNTVNFGNYVWNLMHRADSHADGSNIPGLFGAGKMDDFRIFNYALTTAQIKLLYNNNFSVKYGQ